MNKIPNTILCSLIFELLQTKNYDESMNPKKQKIYLIYDNDCPACRLYVKINQVKKNFDLELIKARSNHELVTECKNRKLDLDEGFVLIIDTRFYHGSEALNHLALISSQSGIFNKFNYWVFKSATRSKILYPFLKFGRNTLLKIRRVKKINAT